MILLTKHLKTVILCIEKKIQKLFGGGIMIKLNKMVKYARTRRFNCVLTSEQEKLHTNNLFRQQDLFNFTNQLLEKMYGYTHLDRKVPSTRVQRRYLIARTILPKYMQLRFNKERWSKRLTGLYSTAAYLFLETEMINFGEYRKGLVEFSKASDKEKQDYQQNKHHNNPQHRAWYHKGALNYLRDSQKQLYLKTVSFERVASDPIKIVSTHYVYVPSYGLVFVRQNLKQYRRHQIKMLRIKRRCHHDYELQLIFIDQVERKPLKSVVGVDWNMHENQVWQTSQVNQSPYVIPKAVIDKANTLEDEIKHLQAIRSVRQQYLKPSSKQLFKLSQRIQYLFQKRSYCLRDWYYQLVHQVIDPLDGIAMELLNIRDMYQENCQWSKGSNRAKNHKLALIKPYELSLIARQVCDRYGKTWLAVDAYHTSQVEFGTHHIEKHDVHDREWRSTLTGKQIKRDLNAAQNILQWSLYPELHAKVWEGKVTTKQAISHLVKINNQ